MTNEKIFSDVKDFAVVFVPVNWIVSIVITLVLYFGFGSEMGLGYAFGALTSFLTFGLLMKNTKSSYIDGQSSVRVRVMGGYVARLGITFVMLLVAFYNDKFNFFATVAGVLMLRVIMFIFVFIRHIFFKDKEAIDSDITI